MTECVFSHEKKSVSTTENTFLKVLKNQLWSSVGFATVSVVNFGSLKCLGIA